MTAKRVVGLLPSWRGVLLSCGGFTGFWYMLKALVRAYNMLKTQAVMTILETFAKYLFLAPYAPLRNCIHRFFSNTSVLPPTRADKVHPAWITEKLLESNEIEPGTVCTGVEAFLFDVGKMSGNARLKLQWKLSKLSGHDCDGIDVKKPPASVVLKMSPTHLDGRIINEIFRIYDEAAFYEEIAPSLPLPTPRCFHSHMDPVTKDYMMLLEDVNNSSLLGSHDEVRPVVKTWSAPMKHIRTILQYLAEMHAQFWCDRSLCKHQFLINHNLHRRADNSAVPSVAGDTNLERARNMLNIHEMLTKLGWRNTKRVLRTGKLPGTPFSQEVMQSVSESLEIYGSDECIRCKDLIPFTIVHGDCHFQNWLIQQLDTTHEDTNSKNTFERLVALDFQMAGLRENTRDVGYFLNNALCSQDRDLHGEGLVRYYYDHLVKCRPEIARPIKPRDRQNVSSGNTDAGSWGDGYTFEMCWARYKFHAVQDWAMVAIATSGALKFETGEEYDIYLAERFYDSLTSAVKSYGTPRALHEQSIKLFVEARAQGGGIEIQPAAERASSLRSWDLLVSNFMLDILSNFS